MPQFIQQPQQRHLNSFRIVRLCTLILLLMLPAAMAFSGDRPFNNAANWGGTGLLEIPTARILEDGIVRLGYAEARPYRWFTGAMGVFPGLEVSGRFTEITNIESNLPGYGAVKDKAFDLKYQLLPESKWFPAVAIGLHDFHGTQQFEAQYLAFSRQVFPLDFTFGIGRKRLRGSAELPFTDELGIWGGVEWAVSKQFHLLAEYNPVQYEKDRASVRGVPEGADIPVNIGLRWKIVPGIDLGLSYQRGDTLGFMAHIQAELGKPLLPKRPDPPWWAPVDRSPFAGRDLQALGEKIQNAVTEAGFRDVRIYTDGNDLAAEFENTKYLSNQKAAGRVLRILLYHSPADTRSLIVILKRRGLPFLKVAVKPDHLDHYLLGKISEDTFTDLLTIEAFDGKEAAAGKEVIGTDDKKDFRYLFGIKPMLQTYLNDPSGVFKARVGIEPYLVAAPWQGGAAIAHYNIPFYSDIESSNPPLPDAVRSDSWLYLDDDPSLDRLMLDQSLRLSKMTFARLSAGYLETMYAGAGGEILTFLGDGSLAVGIEGDWVRKRKPGSTLDLQDLTAHTLLGNIFYKVPGIQTTFQVQYGRFLAGDVGWRFQVGRDFASGLTVGFWYSLTDTDDLPGDFNRDYHDKGIFVHLPARMFTNYETNTKYRYSISPWTRDVAATVNHWKNLFDLGADLMPGDFKRNPGDIKK